jgi:hypothetical protein
LERFTTDTVSAPWLTTYAFVPSGIIAMATGFVPTVTVRDSTLGIGSPEAMTAVGVDTAIAESSPTSTKVESVLALHRLTLAFALDWFEPDCESQRL